MFKNRDILDMHNILNKKISSGGDIINGLKTVNVKLTENISKGDVLECYQNLILPQNNIIPQDYFSQSMNDSSKTPNYISNDKSYFYVSNQGINLTKYIKNINGKFIKDYDFIFRLVGSKFNNIIEIEKYNIIIAGYDTINYVYKKNINNGYDLIDILDAGYTVKTSNEDYLFLGGNTIVKMYKINENSLTLKSSNSVIGGCLGGIDISPDNNRLVVGTGTSPYFYVYNVDYINENFTEIQGITGPGNAVLAVKFSDNNRLYVGLSGNIIPNIRQYNILNDVFTINSVEIPFLTSAVSSLSISPNLEYIIATGTGCVYLYKNGETATFIKNLKYQDGDTGTYLNTMWINDNEFIAYTRTSTNSYMQSFLKKEGLDDFYTTNIQSPQTRVSNYDTIVGNYYFYYKNIGNYFYCSKKDSNGLFTIPILPNFTDVSITSRKVFSDGIKYLFLSVGTASPYYKLFIVNNNDTLTEIFLDVPLSAVFSEAFFAGDYLFIGSSTPIIYKIDRINNTFNKLANISSPLTNYRFISPDARFIITGENINYSNKIYVKNIDDSWSESTLNNNIKYLQFNINIQAYQNLYIFSPDSRKLICESTKGSLTILDTTNDNPNLWTNIPIQLPLGNPYSSESFSVMWIDNDNFVLNNNKGLRTYLFTYNVNLNKFIGKILNINGIIEDRITNTTPIYFYKDLSGTLFFSKSTQSLEKFNFDYTIYGKKQNQFKNLKTQDVNISVGYALTGGNKGDIVQVKLLTHENDF